MLNIQSQRATAGFFTSFKASYLTLQPLCNKKDHMLKHAHYLVYLLCICPFLNATQNQSKNYNADIEQKDNYALITLLAKIYKTASLSFINNVTSLKDKTLLDVDCCSGHMACEFAQQGALVTAASINADHLELAQQEAEKQNINTIEFIKHDIYNLAQCKKTFDIIYCRFVLMHLSEPTKALASLYACLKPNGILIIEEAMGIESITLNPHDQTFTDLIINIGNAQSIISGNNLNYGSLLPEMVQNFNLKKLYSNQHHPELISFEEKQILLLIMKKLNQLLINSNIISEEQINTIEDYLQIIQNNPTFKLHYFKIMQLAAQKS